MSELFNEQWMAAAESGEGDAGAWVETAGEAYATAQAENLAAADLSDDFVADPHYDRGAAWAAGDDWPPGAPRDDPALYEPPSGHHCKACGVDV